eukprot:5505087-Pleurochrysis_carterae.AAC.3
MHPSSPVSIRCLKVLDRTFKEAMANTIHVRQLSPTAESAGAAAALGRQAHAPKRSFDAHSLGCAGRADLMYRDA